MHLRRQLIVLCQVLFWIMGYTTIHQGGDKLTMKGAGRLYVLTLVLITVGSRIERFINNDTKNLGTRTYIPEIMYIIMKFLETTTCVCALISDSLVYRKDKLRMYVNLQAVDRLLRLPKKQFARVESNVVRVVLGYLIGSIGYNVCNYFRWKKGVDQWFLMVKMVIMDLAGIQFCIEMYFNYCRVRALNAHLYDMCVACQTKWSGFCIDFKSIRLYSKSADGRLATGTPADRGVGVKSLIRAYEKLAENISSISSRISATYLMLPCLSLLTVIIIANVYVKAKQYSQMLDIIGNLSLILWMAHYVLYMLCVTGISEVVLAESRRTRELLGKVSALPGIDVDLYQDLLKLKWLVETKELRVTVFGLFPIDFSFLFSLVAVTSSYAVIYIQMSPS